LGSAFGGSIYQGLSSGLGGGDSNFGACSSGYILSFGLGGGYSSFGPSGSVDLTVSGDKTGNIDFYGSGLGVDGPREDIYVPISIPESLAVWVEIGIGGGTLNLGV